MSNNVVLVFLLAENDRQFILIKMGICNSHLVSGIRIKKKRYVNVLVYDSWMLILSYSTSFIIKKYRCNLFFYWFYIPVRWTPAINKFPLTLTSFIGVLFLLCFCCFVYIPELSCLLLLKTEFKSPKPDLWREKKKKNSNFM